MGEDLGDIIRFDAILNGMIRWNVGFRDIAGRCGRVVWYFRIPI